jgi:hypothetical protein
MKLRNQFNAFGWNEYNHGLLAVKKHHGVLALELVSVLCSMKTSIIEAGTLFFLYLKKMKTSIINSRQNWIATD